ncbi:expressed protein [Echinococcus multilocularis]|uniref:Expressed protein n=1 Tax=Echinococcus multilocularis TaxID=6211 RepID=A0A068Y2S4_ECHMU|nr:expressed protein [Echinococcus multilocularis]
MRLPLLIVLFLILLAVSSHGLRRSPRQHYHSLRLKQWRNLAVTKKSGPPRHFNKDNLKFHLFIMSIKKKEEQEGKSKMVGRNTLSIFLFLRLLVYFLLISEILSYLIKLAFNLCPLLTASNSCIPPFPSSFSSQLIK